MKYHQSLDAPLHAVGLGRRDVLRGIAALGTLAAVDGRSALCAPAVAIPKIGGRIRVASVSSSVADTLDPAKGSLSTDYVRHYMLYSGLTQYDASLAAQPALAEHFDDQDATLWTFKLRRGVQFHDGKPLTPADVVYSLLRHKDLAVGSQVRTIAEQFADVRATGPDEVQVRLTAANVDLPVILADSHFLIIKHGTTDFQTAIGTGPYVCQDFNPGVRTVGRRNRNYWKPGRPYLDEIELIGIDDESSRVNAMLAGYIQLNNAINPRCVERVRSTAGYTVHETKSGLYTDLILRQDMRPSGNPDFVLAMKYLLDRDEILNAVFRGYARLGNDQPVPPGNRYYLADLPQRTYDPERARFHLRRAGLVGAQLAMYASPAAERSVDIATLLQESAGKIGLNLSVNRVPSDGYWSNHWMKHPLSFGNINPRPTVDMVFSTFFQSRSAWNESGWKNAEFDGLLIAARSERDEAKRTEMYGRMQTIVHDQCGVGIPVFISILDAHDRRLKGYGSIPIGGLMGYSFAEYVWLDA